LRQHPATCLGQALLVVHVPAERRKEGVEKLKAELFFLVVGRKEDLMVLAETVYEAENGVGGRTHRREDRGSR